MRILFEWKVPLTLGRSARGGCLFDELISNGGLGELMTSRIMRRMFEAVGYLHTIGIVHRDIKLENILLTDQNNLESVKLSDFGVVRIIEEGEGSLATGKEGEGERRRPVILSQVGSVAYMGAWVDFSGESRKGVGRRGTMGR